MSDDAKNARKETLNARVQNKANETSTKEQTDKTSKTDKDASNDRPSTKDKTALTMYLSDEQVDTLDLQFQELNLEYRREHGEKLQKNADFYPAVLEAAFSDRTVREVLEIDG